MTGRRSTHECAAVTSAHQTRRSNWRRLWAAAFLAIACTGDAEARNAAVTVAQVGDDIHLSVSPDALAARADARVLTPFVRVSGKGPAAFGYVADVAATPDGGFAVLDRSRRQVLLFRRDGAFAAVALDSILGKKLLRSPIALEAIKAGLVLFDPVNPIPFLLLPFGGSSAVAGDSARNSDWNSFLLQEPLAFLEQRVAEGPDDYTRRLRRLGDDSVVVEERGPATSPDSAGQIHLSVYDRHMREVGSLTALHLSRYTDHHGATTSGFDVYGPRRLWASGNGWFATADAATSSVVVSGRGWTRQITWPSLGQAIESRDRIRAAEWLAFYTIRENRAARLRAAEMSAGERRDALSIFAGRLSFAARAPELMAMYGAGDCLWLSGWAPKDSRDGTSQTWIGLNVRAPFAATVVRLPRPDVRVRDITVDRIYAAYTDSLGVSYAEVYSISRGC